MGHCRCCFPEYHPNYSADYAAITQRQFARFDGKTWVLFGDVIGADSGGKD